MAKNPNQSTTSSFFERFKKPVAGLALAMGVLSVSACNDVANADKPPVATSSATPGASETGPVSVIETTVDKYDPEALGKQIDAEYAEYLKTLSPESRADIDKFSDPTVYAHKSPEELAAMFALPASLVTKDGTLDTLDPEAYAAAVVARVFALSELAVGDMDPTIPYSAEEAIALTSKYYPIAQPAFTASATPGEVVVTPDSVGYGAALISMVSSINHNKHTDLNFRSHAWFDTSTLSVNRDNGAVRVSIDTINKDNFPTNALEESSGVRIEPTNDKVLLIETLTLENGNVMSMS